MNGRNTRRAYAPLQTQIKIGRIDAYHHTGTFGDDDAADFASYSQYGQKMLEHFSDPHYRQGGNIKARLQAGSDHARTAYSYKASLGIDALDGFDKSRSENIPGDLACGYGIEVLIQDHLMMPRPFCSMKSMSTSISLCSRDRSFNCTKASSMVRWCL